MWLAWEGFCLSLHSPPLFPALLVITKQTNKPKKKKKPKQKSPTKTPINPKNQLNRSTNFVHVFWHLTLLGQENLNSRFSLGKIISDHCGRLGVPRVQDVPCITHSKSFKESRSLEVWVFFLYLRSLAWHSAVRNYWNIYFPMISENVKVFDRVQVPSVLTQNPTLFIPILLLLLIPVFLLIPNITAMQDQFKPPSRWIHMKTSLFSKFFMFRSFKPFRSSSINTSTLSLFSLFICSFCCCFLY